MAYIETPKTRGSSVAIPLNIIGLNFASGQKVTIGVASAQSAVINSDVVLIKCNIDCYINIGVNPTATVNAGSLFLLKGENFITQITPGHKVAVIQASAAGSLYILPAITSV